MGFFLNQQKALFACLVISCGVIIPTTLWFLKSFNSLSVLHSDHNEPCACNIPVNKFYVAQCSKNLDDGRRLGNQIFDFVALLYVTNSLKNNSADNVLIQNALDAARSSAKFQHVEYVPVIRSNPKNWLNQWFDMDVTYSQFQHVKSICSPWVTVLELKDLAFSAVVNTSTEELVARANNSCPYAALCGFFQSWKYTVRIKDEIRRQLKFNKNILDTVMKFFEQHRFCRYPNSTNTTETECDHMRVGVHVRRADYLAPHLAEHGFTVPDDQYLKQAMRHFVNTTRKFIKFYVVSDDMAWTKDALYKTGVIPNNTDVTYSQSNSAGVDLAILANCDGVIMTTGSFGWWGAWLADGATVYYSKWPKPGSKLNDVFDKDDFFPPHWTPIP